MITILFLQPLIFKEFIPAALILQQFLPSFLAANRILVLIFTRRLEDGKEMLSLMEIDQKGRQGKAVQLHHQKRRDV